MAQRNIINLLNALKHIPYTVKSFVTLLHIIKLLLVKDVIIKLVYSRLLQSSVMF